MKNTILKVSAILAAAVFSASCIQETVPVGGSVTQAHGGFNVLDALDRLDGLEILDIFGGESV